MCGKLSNHCRNYIFFFLICQAHIIFHISRQSKVHRMYASDVPTFRGGKGGVVWVLVLLCLCGLQLKPYSYLKIVVVPVDKWSFSIISFIN